jgi:protein TonB
MTDSAAFNMATWAAGAASALLLHAGLLLGVDIKNQVPPPPVQIDLRAADLLRPPPLPPEPLPAPEKKERPPTEPVDMAKAHLAPKEARDDAPPPPSNRPPPPEASARNEPVPIITGVPMMVSKVKGGLFVREGNTDVPGFNPPPGTPVEVRPYTGGVLGGQASQSGGFGAPGPGVGGGASIRKLTKTARVLKKVIPRYPDNVSAQDIEGKVVLRVEVKADGKTGRVSVVRSDHPELNRYAIAAIKKFKWAPAEIDGDPVASWILFTVRFELYG